MSCPLKYTFKRRKHVFLVHVPISVDVENILGRPDEHENSDGGGDELRRGKGDSKPAPHPGSQLGLDHLHPRHPNHITTHSLHIDRREIEESPGKYGIRKI